MLSACDNSKIKSISKPDSIEYLVEDEFDNDDNGMEKSTTLSRTFIPKQYIDDEKNAWVDCPGFEDTRNTTTEIAAAYLIKQIIESAASVKFVLVADFNSISESHSDFDNLLTYATRLIKNVQKSQ